MSNGNYIIYIGSGTGKSTKSGGIKLKAGVAPSANKKGNMIQTINISKLLMDIGAQDSHPASKEYLSSKSKSKTTPNLKGK